jgi:hypothetical protein
MSTIDDIQNLNDGEAAEHRPPPNVRDFLDQRLAAVHAHAPQHEGEQS